MTPSQYTGITRSYTPLPILGHFVESKRWGEGKKPKLFSGSTVALGAVIEKIHRERDINRAISQVDIEVITISYISTQTHPSPASHCIIFLFF